MTSKKLDRLKKLEDKFRKELKDIETRKLDLEIELELLNELRGISLIGAEGDTISYKLGKVLLNTRSLKDVLLLPKRLIEVRRFAKKKLAQEGGEIQEKNHKVNTVIKKKPVPSIGNGSMFSSVLTLSSNLDYLLYRNCFPAYYLTENYHVQLANTQAKFMLIDSTMVGVKGYWKYGLLSDTTVYGKKLLEAFSILKEKNMPIIFIFKSTELDMNKFMHIFKIADYIFFEDQNILENISRKKVSQASVGLITPIAPAALVVYANNLVVERPSEKLLYIAINADYFSCEKRKHISNIIEKNSNKIVLLELEGAEYIFENQNVTKNKLPIEFTEKEIIKNIKNYKFTVYIPSLNDNFIPREILFSLIAGVPVITLKNEYLKEVFGDALIYCTDSRDIQNVTQYYLDNKWEYLQKIKIAHRLLFSQFSEEIFKQNLFKSVAKQKVLPEEKKPLVSIIMASMREHYIDRIITNIKRQNYNNIEFIIVTQSFTNEGLKTLRKELAKLNNLRAYKIVENNSDDTLGERQNQAASFAKGEYLAKFDDDDFYFDNYLSDTIGAFSLGNYDLVGKAEFFIYLEALNQTVLIRDGKAANREMDFVSGATFVIRKEKFDELGGFVSVNQSEDSNLLKRLKESGGKIYSSDPFNFIVFRSANVTDHTWQQKAEAFAKSCTLVSEGFADTIASI